MISRKEYNNGRNGVKLTDAALHHIYNIPNYLNEGLVFYA